jgi:protein-tyrosine phosphatase
MTGRAVAWGGLHNARDLGGLPVETAESAESGTTTTQCGRIYRAPRLDGLDDRGWQQLVDAGVRTIVDLRNPHEIALLPLPPAVVRHHRPVEVWEDRDFMARWGEVLNSPAYYRACLDTWPHLMVDVVRTIADTPDGGVVVHCSAGRDRTGLVTALLLALVGVATDAIVDDYACSVIAMDSWAAGGHGDEAARTADELAAWLAVVTAQLRELLEGLDVAGYLTAHGLTDDELARVRARLLD